MSTQIRLIIALAVSVIAGMAVLLSGPGVKASLLENLSAVEGDIPKHTGPLPPLTSGTHDWPQWKGPDLDGRSSVTGIRKDWTGGLKKQWEIGYLCRGEKTASWSAPVIKGNRLVVTGRDDARDYLYCLDPVTGAPIWTSSYQSDAEDDWGKGARATPTIDGERVYTFDRNGGLACWQLHDGTLLWRASVTNEGGAPLPFGHASSPFIMGDIVVVQGGGDARTLAFNKLDGKLAWKSGTGNGGHATATTMTIDERTLLLVFHQMGLAALDPADGAQLWDHPFSKKGTANATTPFVRDNTVFLTIGSHGGSVALKASATGAEVLWKNKAFSAAQSDPFLFGDYLYGYSGDGTQNNGSFRCVELASGELKWKTNDIGMGECIAVDGHILCLTVKGTLYLVKPEPDGLRTVAEMPEAIAGIKRFAWTMPVIAEGRLYLRYKNQLICYDLMGK